MIWLQGIHFNSKSIKTDHEKIAGSLIIDMKNIILHLFLGKLKNTFFNQL